MSKTDDINEWKSLLDKTEEEVWKAIDNMAEELRQRVILPMCRRHRLTFTSGNGTWWFTRIDAERKAEARRERITYLERTHWSFHDQDEALKHGLDLGNAWELLMLEPIHACPLGYRVEAVTEADLADYRC
jgi:hypothetical protein